MGEVPGNGGQHRGAAMWHGAVWEGSLVVASSGVVALQAHPPLLVGPCRQKVQVHQEHLPWQLRDLGRARVE